MNTNNVKAGDMVVVSVCTIEGGSAQKVVKVTAKTITVDWCGQVKTFRERGGNWWNDMLVFNLDRDLVTI
jgi:hypothetical protein